MDDVWWNNHYLCKELNHPIETTIYKWMFQVPEEPCCWFHLERHLKLQEVPASKLWRVERYRSVSLVHPWKLTCLNPKMEVDGRWFFLANGWFSGYILVFQGVQVEMVSTIVILECRLQSIFINFTPTSKVQLPKVFYYMFSNRYWRFRHTQIIHISTVFSMMTKRIFEYLRDFPSVGGVWSWIWPCMIRYPELQPGKKHPCGCQQVMWFGCPCIMYFLSEYTFLFKVLYKRWRDSLNVHFFKGAFGQMSIHFLWEKNPSL